MIILESKTQNDAEEIAKWMNDNVCPGDYVRPSTVIIIAQTLRWQSYDKHVWSVSFINYKKAIQVSGVKPEDEVLFRLRFGQ